jgi:hypothetical protein
MRFWSSKIIINFHTEHEHVFNKTLVLHDHVEAEAALEKLRYASVSKEAHYTGKET